MSDETCPYCHWHEASGVAHDCRAELQKSIYNLRNVVSILWTATFQGHTEHWDKTQRFGAGCPACIRTQRLRDLAADTLGYRPEMFYEQQATKPWPTRAT